MELSKNKLFIGILVFMILIDILIAFNLNLFHIRAVLAFLFIILIPGLLIMLMMKIRQLGFWEYLVYVVGLSIAFIMFAGLAVNWILPWLNITDKPLSTWPILICFNIFLIAFWIIAYLRNKDLKPFKVQFPKLDALNTIMFTIPILFPFMAIIGAFLLNNYGTNIITMVMLGAIAAYVFCIVLFRKRLNPNIYPWALYLMGLALLLSFSMRSWYISGWDINVEYQVFNLTKENFHWSLSNLNDPYNAMLSISILPTILSWFLKINSQYIFKFLFQIIFSLVPIAIYLFLKRYAKNVLAFIAGFFFISQWQFITQMPTLARQQIALLFFSLILLILFNKKINSELKKVLFLIFGFSIIVSHYSTIYISLALFISVWIIYLIFRKNENKRYFSRIYEKLNLKEKTKETKERKNYFRVILILLLVIFSFLWLSQLTQNSNDLIDFTHKTIDNMGKIFTNDLKTEEVRFALWGRPTIPTIKDTQNYEEELSLDYKINRPEIKTYDKESQKDYSIRPAHSDFIPFVNILTQKIMYYFHTIVTSLVKLFFLIGSGFLIFTKFKKQKIDKEYLIMVFGCVILMGIILFAPQVSVGYNFERLYQQNLVILSLPAVFGGLLIAKFLKKENYKIILVILIFIAYFSLTSGSGVLYQITGGGTNILFNNFGVEYDRIYTYTNEVSSAAWFSNNYDSRKMIYADKIASLRLASFGKINYVIYDLLPSTIDKDAYVYTSYTNTIKNTAFFRKIGAGYIGYNFPKEFLNDNKNKIYANGGSEIFK